jgi:hypothetical protein
MYKITEAIIMKSLKGVVSKIRVLKVSRTPFLDNVNCLIAVHSLSFLADFDNGNQIVIVAKFNDYK